MPKGRVLIVDDEPGQTEILRGFLHPCPIETKTANSTAAALQLMAAERFHAVLCDLVMEGGGGLEVLRFVRSQGLQTPVIIITGYGDEETAEECLSAGAFDFISKPIDRLSLIAVLRRALVRTGLIFNEVRPLPPCRAPGQFPHLIGTSRVMKEILARVAKVAEADTNTCIYGESGTGKELVARAIHYSGPRAQRPLIVLDCAAIPEGLMESEMFGHVRGAFTSALSDREGLFQLADGGTLFLDEIAELSLPLQAKLLRVIQCREFRKVGGQTPIKVDVRIISATNKDLRGLMGAGTFREDLFYRLEVVPITLPPLRDRKEDIPLLVNHFIEKFNRNNKKQIRGVTSRTMGAFLRHDWPGNIRELENCIERAAVMADGEVLDPFDLTPILRSAEGSGTQGPNGPSLSSPRSLKDVERDLILKTLESVNGNRTRAAGLLGISLRGLHYRLKSLKQGGTAAVTEKQSADRGGNGRANA